MYTVAGPTIVPLLRAYEVCGGVEVFRVSEMVRTIPGSRYPDPGFGVSDPEVETSRALDTSMS